jgi:hypothetical protein
MPTKATAKNPITRPRMPSSIHVPTTEMDWPVKNSR